VCCRHPAESHDERVPAVAEITLRCQGARRLTCGFGGWDVEARGPLTILRMVGATDHDIHEALAQVSDLALDLESFRLLETSS
jgi:hypothetical protein